MVETQDTERALTDGRGCLTPRGFALLQEAAPGSVPEALAFHLAGCAACQQRALETETGPRTGPKRAARPVMPSAGRAALLVLGFVVVLGILLWSLRRVIGS